MSKKEETQKNVPVQPYEYMIAPVIACIVLALSAFFLFTGSKEFSDNENRNLTQFEKPTKENIFDKTFMDNTSTFLCDQFPFRDGFINVKTQFEKLTFHNEINGIYLCDDGFYIEPFTEPENSERIIKILNKFPKSLKKAKPVLMLVPNACYVYSDKLPSHAVSADQSKTIDMYYDQIDMDHIDVRDVLKSHNNEDNLYYKLDHHWTTHGAYLAYTKYCDAMGITATKPDDYEIKTVTTDFRGTVFSKVNDLFAEPDSIDLYYYKGQDLSVDYNLKKTTSDSLYELEYLDKKDKYSVFLNNLNSLVTIENKKADTDKELVVIKDSYANSMIPFLVSHYKTIYVFDTRYYKLPVSRFINSHENVEDVLILYNLNTMDTDLGIKTIY